MVMAKETAELQIDVTSKGTIDISFTAFDFNVVLSQFFPFFKKKKNTLFERNVFFLICSPTTKIMTFQKKNNLCRFFMIYSEYF